MFDVLLKDDRLLIKPSSGLSVDGFVNSALIPQTMTVLPIDTLDEPLAFLITPFKLFYL